MRASQVIVFTIFNRNCRFGSTPNWLQIINKQTKKQMAIYVRFAEQKLPDTIYEFLKQFYSRSFNPYYASGHLTYLDKECLLLQDSHNWRSFDDLLELVETYYGEIDPVRFMHFLLTVKISNDSYSYKPHLGACGTMNKIRYIPYIYPAYEGIDKKMKSSKYTWNDLLIPLNINNFSEFHEYIK
jgi:hypothetical protein